LTEQAIAMNENDRSALNYAGAWKRGALKWRSWRISFVVLIGLVVIFESCKPVRMETSEQAGTTSIGSNPALIVLPSASDVQWSDPRLSDGEVYYKVKDQYPAAKSINEIQKRLARVGWYPRQSDFWRPGWPGFVTAMAKWSERQANGHAMFTWSQQWQRVLSPSESPC
jgi:hypothetical protein